MDEAAGGLTNQQPAGERQPGNRREQRTEIMTTQPTALLPSPTMVAIAAADTQRRWHYTRTTIRLHLLRDRYASQWWRVLYVDHGRSDTRILYVAGQQSETVATLPPHASTHAIASAVDVWLTTLDAKVRRAAREEARLATAMSAAAKGDWQAILAYPAGRKYAAGKPCPRGTLPAAALRQARQYMAERVRRAEDRGRADGARDQQTGRILRLAERRRVEREQAREMRLAKRLRCGKLGRAALLDLIRSRRHHGHISTDADGMVVSIVRQVGTIGDQATADLVELRTSESFSGKRGRHHRLERTVVDRVQLLRDWSAAIITMRDYRQFGSSNWGDGYGTRGGSSYRAYLIVRDATTAEAHIIRIPPRFGNDETRFFRQFSSDAERIHAAAAWTFGRKPAEYAPAVEA